jgi:hypothetical protein
MIKRARRGLSIRSKDEENDYCNGRKITIGWEVTTVDCDYEKEIQDIPHGRKHKSHVTISPHG